MPEGWSAHIAITAAISSRVVATTGMKMTVQYRKGMPAGRRAGAPSAITAESRPGFCPSRETTRREHWWHGG